MQKHRKELAKVEEELEQITQSMRDARLDSEQQAILVQKRMDLAAAKERKNMALDSYQVGTRLLRLNFPLFSSHRGKKPWENLRHFGDKCFKTREIFSSSYPS